MKMQLQIIVVIIGIMGLMAAGVAEPFTLTRQRLPMLSDELSTKSDIWCSLTTLEVTLISFRGIIALTCDSSLKVFERF